MCIEMLAIANVTLDGGGKGAGGARESDDP